MVSSKHKQKLPFPARICLILAVGMQAAVIAWMFIHAYNIKAYALAHHTIIRISCTAYDPYDPFKGRYVQLTLSNDDLESAGRTLGLNLHALSTTACAYYMQENYARAVDRINWKDFNALEPVLELYVDDKGNAIQKSLLVHADGQELPIERYIKNRLIK